MLCRSSPVCPLRTGPWNQPPVGPATLVATITASRGRPTSHFPQISSVRPAVSGSGGTG
jgi:hypothetical protein